MRKKFLSLALALTMITSLVPTASVEAAKVKKPSLSRSKLSLEVGAKKTLKLKRAPKLSKKKIKKVKWSSSNSKVVRVSVRGKKRDKAIVTALAKGSATVKVKYNGKTYKCKLTVIGTGSTRRDTEVVTEHLTEQPKTTEQEKTTEKPSGENTKPSEEKPTPHVHNYSDWKTVVTATCVKDGSEKRECSCGDKETRIIKALGHQWDNGKVTKAATCAVTGVKTYICTACGITKKESIPTKTEHTWNAGIITKVATYTESGIKTYTCLVCQKTKTEEIPKLVETEHKWNYNNGVVTKEATCTADGIMTFYCDTCGESMTMPIFTSGHIYDTGVVTTEPTCARAGVRTYTCENCGCKKTEEIAKIANHVYGTGVIVKKPTCADEGTMVYTCKVCGNVKTEELEAMGHQWDEGKVTKNPTCAAQGVKTYTCTICGNKKTEMVAKITNHTYDAGVITKNPTLESAGVKVYTCSICKNQTKEYLPQLISDNIITVTAAGTKEARRYKNVVGETPSQAGFYVNMAYEGVIVDYGDTTARVFYVFNGGQPFLYRETDSMKGIVAPMFGNSLYLDIIANCDFGGIVTEKVESAPDMAAFYSLSDVRTLIDRMISDGRLEDRSYELRPAECYWMQDDTE